MNVCQFPWINSFSLEINRKAKKSDLCGKEITLFFINGELCLIQTINYTLRMLGIFLSAPGVDDQVIYEKNMKGRSPKIRDMPRWNRLDKAFNPKGVFLNIYCFPVRLNAVSG